MFFLKKYLIGNSFKNISKKNVFAKNTSNRNTTKHGLSY